MSVPVSSMEDIREMDSIFVAIVMLAAIVLDQHQIVIILPVESADD